MIKSNELRIGNRTSNGIVVNVFEDYFYTKGGVTTYNSKYHETNPIKLTEEWLIKFGFTIIKTPHGTMCGFIKGKFKLEISNSCNIYYKKILVKYVHQLQNLYFVLTGYELQYVA